MSEFKIRLTLHQPRLDNLTVSRCIEFILASADDLTRNSHPDMKNALIASSMLSGIRGGAQDGKVKLTIQAALHAVDGEEFWDRIGTIQPCSDHAHCERSEICPVAASLKRNQLSLDIGTLVLNSTAVSASLEHPQRLSSLWQRTVNNLKLALETLHPISAPRTPQDSLNYELPISTQSPQTSLDWKSKLSRHLLLFSEQSHSQIIHQVQSICRDFEMRCENVEAPLRSVNDELDKTIAEYEASKIKCDKLEQKAATDSALIAKLRSENVGFRSEVDRLTADLESAQKDLDNTVQTNRERVRSIQEKGKDSEYKYTAIITARDAMVEGLQEEIEELKAENQKLMDLVQETSSLKKEALGRNKELQDMVFLEQKAAQEKERQCRDQETTISMLQTETIALRSALEEKENLVSYSPIVSPEMSLTV